MSGGVDKTVVIDSNGRAVENMGLCIALKKLGVRYIPVSHGVSESIFIPLESLGFSKTLIPVFIESSETQRSFSIETGLHHLLD